MPIHDWTKVDAGSFHALHHGWIEELSRALNRGLLSSEYYALPEQVGGGYVPDVLTLKRPVPAGPKSKSRKRADKAEAGGIAIAEAPPKTTFHLTARPKWFGVRQSSVAVRHVSGNEMVAVIEVVSSGNKSGEEAFDQFVRKARKFLVAGVHLMLLDLYPPTRRAPHGIHPAVWGDDDVFRYKKARPLTCASYLAGPEAEGFVEPRAVGDRLPELPLFLTPSVYILPPLEATYRAAFDALPEYVRNQVTG